MKSSNLALITLFTLFTGIILFGCATSVFKKEPFVDLIIDTSGKQLLADNQRRWGDWLKAVDPQIRAEGAGRSAPGFSSWNEKWHRQIRALEQNQENAYKYIDYIIEERRRKGLPELELQQDFYLETVDK